MALVMGIAPSTCVLRNASGAWAVCELPPSGWTRCVRQGLPGSRTSCVRACPARRSEDRDLGDEERALSLGTLRRERATDRSDAILEAAVAGPVRRVRA